jgi:hypothetical protein
MTEDRAKEEFPGLHHSSSAVNDDNDDDDDDFVLKISLSVGSIILSAGCCLAAAGIIWFERFGSDQEKMI